MAAVSEDQARMLEALSAWVKKDGKAGSPGYHVDMMLDLQRNKAYRKAISDAVNGDEEAFVLEIGTGSGLLSLFAAETCAQHIFTVEGDGPVAAAARRVIEANNMSDKVTVLNKMSSSVEVGWSADMPCRADVLVAEIFDSALVGEGVVPSFLDAHARLVAPGARVVPHRGRLFAAGFRSSRLRRMDFLQAEAIAALRVAASGQAGGEEQREACEEECGSKPNPAWWAIDGWAPLFQIQAADMIRRGDIVIVTEEVEVMSFEFSRPEALSCDASSQVELGVIENGPIHGILCWWELDMVPDGTTSISTSPFSDDELKRPARGHWQQAAAIFHEEGQGLPMPPGRYTDDHGPKDNRNRHVGDVLKLRAALVNGGWDIVFADGDVVGSVDADAPPPCAVSVSATTAPPLQQQPQQQQQEGGQMKQHRRWQQQVRKSEASLKFPVIPRARLVQLNDVERTQRFANQVDTAIANALVGRDSARGGGGSSNEVVVMCLTDGLVGVAATIGSMKRITAARGEGALRLPVLTGSETKLYDAVSAALGSAIDTGHAVSLEALEVPRFCKPSSFLSIASRAWENANDVAGSQTKSRNQKLVLVCEPYDNSIGSAGLSWGLSEVHMIRQRCAALGVFCDDAHATGGDIVVPSSVLVIARVFSCSEFRRRRLPVEHVEGFDLRPFAEDAPLWDAHGVRRSSLQGWNPSWITPRMAARVNLAPQQQGVSKTGGNSLGAVSDFSVRLESKAEGVGAADGVALWVEEEGDDMDPLVLVAVGVHTPEHALKVDIGDRVVCKISCLCAGNGDDNGTGVTTLCNLNLCK